MNGLPKLPGNSFVDYTKQNFSVPQYLTYKNGYQIPKAHLECGIGGERIYPDQLSQSELDELANFQPSLTYGKAKQKPPKAYIPAHVTFDKKVLRFYGYFKESVTESPNEHYRVRKIVLYYFLEDDSISIYEPVQENSGIPQGKLIRRQRLPKNEVGEFFSWKDINCQTNLCVYGRVYRITDCDAFTKTFLESEGIEVNPSETLPPDPYLSCRALANLLGTSKTPSSFDSRLQFLEMDRKVLRFYAIWDDRREIFGDIHKCVIHYFLVDDTVEIRETLSPNSGRDPFPVLIRRDKIPIDRYNVTPTFPSVVLELSDAEVDAYVNPRSFQIGATINILGRRFLIYDCDSFTKAFYYQNMGITDFTSTNLSFDKLDKQMRDALSDSMPVSMDTNNESAKDGGDASGGINQMTLSKQRNLSFLKQIDYGSTSLRYEAQLDGVQANVQKRRFIISYLLASDMITIFEIPEKNSGIAGGTYLSKCRIAKPGSTVEKPQYYSPYDFYIGAKIDIFGNRFVIVNADLFVLKFLEERAQEVPAHVLESIREKVQATEQNKIEKNRLRGMQLKRREGDVMQMMREIQAQLKKLAIIDKPRIDEMFLRYNKPRQQAIDLEALKAICRKMQLPDDDDIISAFLSEYGTNMKMDLEQFRNFFEN